MSDAIKDESGPALLKEWRLREGLTQTQAAARLNSMHQSSYCDYENGRTVPRIDTLVLIRDIAGVPIESWQSAKRKTGTEG